MRLFLPAAGYRWGSELNNAGNNGNYWSRSLNPNNSNNAYNLNFNSDNVWDNNANNRNNGFAVRPVVLPAADLALSFVLLFNPWRTLFHSLARSFLSTSTPHIFRRGNTRGSANISSFSRPIFRKISPTLPTSYSDANISPALRPVS